MTETIDGPQKGSTRRKFLVAASQAAVGLGLFGLWREAMKQGNKEETIIDFSTGKADYRFLGGAHGNINLGDNLNIVTTLRKEMIPSNTSFFELEIQDDYLASDFYPQLWKLYAYGPKIAILAFTKDVLLELTQRRLPLVLTDIPRPEGLDPELIGIFGGAALLGSIGLGAQRDKNITRRKFLQGGAAAGLGLLGLRAWSNDLISYLRSVASEDWAQKLAQVNHYIELSEPESLVVTFRNALISAKTLGLEDRLPKNTETNKPKGVLIYGSGHWGIPEYMKSGQQSLIDYLSLYPKPFIETFFGKDNPLLYTSVVITPLGDDGFKTEKVENQHLKKIFKK